MSPFNTQIGEKDTNRFTSLVCIIKKNHIYVFRKTVHTYLPKIRTPKEQMYIYTALNK